MSEPCKVEEQVTTEVMDTMSVQEVNSDPQTRFQCILCDIKFRRKDNMKNHVVVDHKIPLVRCEYCRYTFLSEEELSSHISQLKKRGMDTHTEAGRRKSELKAIERRRSNYCNTCKKGFTTKFGLKKHAVNVHGNVMRKCTYCRATFIFESELYHHLQQQHAVDASEDSEMTF